MNLNILIKNTAHQVSPATLLKTFTANSKEEAVARRSLLEQFTDYFGTPTNQQLIENLFDEFFPVSNSLNSDAKKTGHTDYFEFVPSRVHELNPGYYKTHNLDLLPLFLKKIHALLDKAGKEALLGNVANVGSHPVCINFGRYAYNTIKFDFFGQIICFKPQVGSFDENYEAAKKLIESLTGLCPIIIFKGD